MNPTASAMQAQYQRVMMEPQWSGSRRKDRKQVEVVSDCSRRPTSCFNGSNSSSVEFVLLRDTTTSERLSGQRGKGVVVIHILMLQTSALHSPMHDHAASLGHFQNASFLPIYHHKSDAIHATNPSHIQVITRTCVSKISFLHPPAS